MRTPGIPPDPWADPHLQDLGREALELLRGHLHARRFRKGELLWREGDTTGMLVALRSGRVKIYRLLPNAREVTLFHFGPGDLFGFLPFLDGQAYPAYAQAMDDVEADVMARTTLLQALRAEPDLAVTLIALLGGRLRSAFDLVQSMSTPGAQARVAQALLALVPPEAMVTATRWRSASPCRRTTSPACWGSRPRRFPVQSPPWSRTASWSARARDATVC